MTGSPAGGRAGHPRSSRSPAPSRRAGRPQRSDGGERAAATPSAPAGDPAAWARELTLGWLGLRPHTRAELAGKLRRKGVAEDVAELVLERFDEVGLVDDAAFAASWVDSRHAGRGLARRALGYELRRRGVAGPTVDEALARVDGSMEVETARALVERRLRSLAGQPRPAQVRRLVGLLARKGYPAGVAARVVREVLERADALGVEEDAALLALEDDAHREE